MATKPNSTEPSWTAASTSGIVEKGTSSPAARSAWVRSACSVKVPSGPRKPTGGFEVSWTGTGCQDSDVDDEALRAFLADIASGRVDPDAAVERLQRLPFADLGYARVDHHR